MDTAIEIEYHLKKIKKQKSPKATSTHQLIDLRRQTQALGVTVVSTDFDYPIFRLLRIG